MPADPVIQLLFDCYQLAVPPVLKAAFHTTCVPKENVRLCVPSWFATRCCLMEAVGPKFHALLKNPAPRGLSFEKHLRQVKNTLSAWAAPDVLTGDDLFGSASEFVEDPYVISRFVTNHTIRQQWLAVALATVLKVSKFVI